MSLPATDDFNRADANPIGGNWTTVPGQQNVELISNHIRSSSGGAVGAAYWNADTFANDHYSQVVPLNVGASAEGPMVRMSAARLDGYLLYLGGSGTAIIFRMDNGSPTSLTTPNFAFANGDTIKLEAVGTTLTAYKNGVAQASPATDATYATGSAGVYLADAAATVDDWGGGNVGGAVYDFTYIRPWMIA